CPARLRIKTSGHPAPAFHSARVRSMASKRTKQLGQLVHCSVEQVRILKVGLIARLLVRNRLQTSREWFVPLRRERSNVSEDTFHLSEADLAGERDPIQAGATNGRVSEQGVDVVGGLSPALCQKLVLHNRHHQSGVADLFQWHSLDRSSDDASRSEGSAGAEFSAGKC